LSTYLSPPSIPEPSTTLSASKNEVTSTIVNVVYARNYPVSGSHTLNTGAKYGIGVGAGIAGLASLGLLLFLCRRWLTRRRENSWYGHGVSSSSYGSGFQQPP